MLGSASVWTEYHPWEVPSLLYALVGNLSALLVCLGPSWLISKTSTAAFIQKLKDLLIDEGLGTLLCLAVAAATWLPFLLKPPEESPTEALLRLMPLTREGSNAAKAKLDSIRRMSRLRRYKTAFELADLVIQYEQKERSWPRSQYEACQNELGRLFAEVAVLESDSFVRECQLWGRIASAGCAEQNGNLQEATRTLTEVAHDEAAPRRLRSRAWNDLAANHLTHAADMTPEVLSTAFVYLFRAIQQEPDWRALGNIAYIHIKREDFTSAEAAYDDGLTAVRRLRAESRGALSSTREAEANLLVSKANCLRKQGQRASGEVAGQLYQRAKVTLHAAEAIDPGYMDRYWNGIHLALAMSDFAEARSLVARAQVVLSRPEHYELARYRRYGYLDFGMGYTAWLAIRADVASVGMVTTETRTQATSAIPGFAQSPKSAIGALLADVQNGGYTVDDDRAFLETWSR